MTSQSTSSFCSSALASAASMTCVVESAGEMGAVGKREEKRGRVCRVQFPKSSGKGVRGCKVKREEGGWVGGETSQPKPPELQSRLPGPVGRRAWLGFIRGQERNLP
jgi:hypothetical protein